VKGDTAWQAEERAQAQRLGDIIQKAIQDDGLAIAAEGRAPMLNAVAGALVNVEAAMLAAIPDPRNRKALRQAMERARPRALAEAMTRDNGKVQVITIGGVKQ
jgi:hypothetical protein